jgi:hypothetical protein
MTTEQIIQSMNQYEEWFTENAQTWAGFEASPEDTYEFIDRQTEGNFVLLSAPHAVNHCRHNDWFGFDSQPPTCKPQDRCTGALIRTLHDLTGTPIIYNSSVADDPNYYHNIIYGYATSQYGYTDAFDSLDDFALLPYKDKIRTYLNNNPNIKIVFDFHSVGYGYGCESSTYQGDTGSCYEWVVDLGTGGPYGTFGEQSQSINSNFGENQLQSIIEDAFTTNNLSAGGISYNQFQGWIQDTVTKYSSKCDLFGVESPEECVDAIQFEMNTEAICTDLTDDETIANVVRAIVDIIEAINQYYAASPIDEDMVFISEMQFDIPGALSHGNRNYPFIELYNPTFHTIDISGWSIHGLSSCGDNWWYETEEIPECTTCSDRTIFTFPQGSKIYPKNFVSTVRRKETWLPLCDDEVIWSEPGMCADGYPCRPDIWYHLEGEVPGQWFQNGTPIYGWPTFSQQWGHNGQDYIDFVNFPMTMINGSPGTSTDCMAVHDYEQWELGYQECWDARTACYNEHGCYDLIPAFIYCSQCDFNNFEINDNCAENCLTCFGPNGCDEDLDVCESNISEVVPGTDHGYLGYEIEPCNLVRDADYFCHPKIELESQYNCCAEGAYEYSINPPGICNGMNVTNWSQCAGVHVGVDHIRFPVEITQCPYYGTNQEFFCDEWLETQPVPNTFEHGGYGFHRILGGQCGEYFRVYKQNGELVTFVDMSKNQLHLHDEDWSAPRPEGVEEYGDFPVNFDHGAISAILKFPEQQGGWLEHDNNDYNNWAQGNNSVSKADVGLGNDLGVQQDMDLPEVIIFGCMEASAANYNPDATIEDGSCQYGYTAPETAMFEIQSDMEGNNLISFPKELVDTDVHNFIELQESYGTEIVFITGKGVGLFNTCYSICNQYSPCADDPDCGWAGNLNNFEITSGYWFNVYGPQVGVDDPAILRYEAYIDSEPFVYDIGISDNYLLSYDGDDLIPTIEAFQNASVNIEPYVTFILGRGQGLFNSCWQECDDYQCSNSDCGWSGNLNTLTQDKGYWINTSCRSWNNWCEGADSLQWYRSDVVTSEENRGPGPGIMTHTISGLGYGNNFISLPFELVLPDIPWADFQNDVTQTMSYLAWWGHTLGQGVGIFCEQDGNPENIDHENCGGNLNHWDKTSGYWIWLQHSSSNGTTLNLPGYPIETDLIYDISGGGPSIISFNGTQDTPTLHALGEDKKYIEHILGASAGLFNLCLTDWKTGVTDTYEYDDTCWVGNLNLLKPYHGYWIDPWCGQSPLGSDLEDDCPTLSQFQWNL